MNQQESTPNWVFRPHSITRTQYRKTLTEVDRGEIIRLGRGLYASPEALLSSVVDIDVIIPGGILCLYSAWAIHQLTTQIPDGWYVAVDNKRKIVLPYQPKINLIYISGNILALGIETIEIDGIKNKVYNVERSVCDAIKYRNKIGLDVMSEILTNYLKRENRNIKRLLEYADKLRVRKILNNYLDVKL